MPVIVVQIDRNPTILSYLIVVHYGEKVFGYTVAAAASVAGAVASRRIQLAHTAATLSREPRTCTRLVALSPLISSMSPTCTCCRRGRP